MTDADQASIDRVVATPNRAFHADPNAMQVINGLLTSLDLPLVAAQWSRDLDQPQLLGFCRYVPPAENST